MQNRPLVSVFSGAILTGALLLGGMVAPAAASTQKGGTVHVFVTGSGSGDGADIILTGAIGDFGSAANIDANGTPDNNGNYVVLDLSQGTFRVNISGLNTKANKVNPPFNPTTCSANFSVTSPAALSDGTGLYQGITGSITLTLTFIFVGPKNTSGKKQGQCNQSNSAQPLAQEFTVTGSGAVSFG